MIRRITIAVLAAALTGAVLAVPASSSSGPATVAKKKAKKCKKGKKGKKRKGCNRGSSSVVGLPGQATPASPKQPDPPAPPPDNPVLHVSSLALNAGTVLRGNSTSGQVTLDQVAPAGGQQVDLTSDLPALVMVPASVVVISGQKTASFQVDTTTGTPDTATLTASIATSNATTTLKVVDRPSVASVKLERQCFKAGTTWSANLVTLDIPAPGNTVVSLVSGDPDSLFLPQSTVTVPSGSTSQLFTVNALAPPSVPGPVMVSASVPSTPEQSDSAPVSATDPDTEAEGVTLDSDTVAPGDGSTGTLTLTCEAPPSGTPVTFSSDDPSNIGLPAPGDITVPVGQLSVEFPITTEVPTEFGSTDGTYDISATAGGVTVHATLTISSVLPT